MPGSERDDGFYWVRTRSGRQNECVDDWTVGEWHDGNWFVVGCELFLDDSDIAEIGERITRDAK